MNVVKLFWLVIVSGGSLATSICLADGPATLASGPDVTFTDPTYTESSASGQSGVFELRLERPRGCDRPVTLRYQPQAGTVELIFHDTDEARWSEAVRTAVGLTSPLDTPLTATPSPRPVMVTGEIALAR